MTLLLCLLPLLSVEPDQPTWASVAPGVEYRRFQLGSGDSVAHVVRVDPAVATVRVHALEPGDKPMGVREWSEKYDLVFATNAGMFAQDGRTHIGYFKVGGKELTRGFHPTYRSAFGLHPLEAALPYFQIIDTDESDWAAFKDRYATVVQNLRLIKAPGENRWSRNGRKWSEMALGQDGTGRLLFMFTRVPFAMQTWNDLMLGLPLDLVAAHHLEGGMEAQFYLRLPEGEIVLKGGWLGEVNALRDIPHIIGVATGKE